MLSLLQPQWLFALTGISIPLIIHLWNDRRGKVLAIGSVLLLDKYVRRQSRSRRLTELLLLLLRCLLLIFLALFLAGPSWKRSSHAAGVKGWVLVEAPEMGEEGAGAAVDSLVNAGYEKHVWEKDSAQSLWRSFERADAEAPGGLPFYVFTSGRLNRFVDRRPVVSRPVHWMTYTVKDTLGSWTAASWRMAPDSMYLLKGSSRSTGNTYVLTHIPAGAGEAVNADTTALQIVLYADASCKQDARYLAAALEALRQYTKQPIRVRTASTVDDIAAWRKKGLLGEKGIDWLFWLSSQPLPAGSGVPNVLLYVQGKAQAVNSWIRENSGPLVREDPTSLSRLIVAADTGNHTLWADGFGRPVLTCKGSADRTQEGNALPQGAPVREYRFFSRFDPAWNGLTWSPRFPELLYGLLFQWGFIPPSRDLRVIDPAQIAPARVQVGARGGEAAAKAGGTEAAGAGKSIDLGPACWVLLCLLFIAERAIVYLTSKTATNG